MLGDQEVIIGDLKIPNGMYISYLFTQGLGIFKEEGVKGRRPRVVEDCKDTMLS